MTEDIQEWWDALTKDIQEWWDALSWDKKESLLVCRRWGNMSLEEQQRVGELYMEQGGAEE